MSASSISTSNSSSRNATSCIRPSESMTPFSSGVSSVRPVELSSNRISSLMKSRMRLETSTGSDPLAPMWSMAIGEAGTNEQDIRPSRPEGRRAAVIPLTPSGPGGRVRRLRLLGRAEPAELALGLLAGHRGHRTRAFLPGLSGLGQLALAGLPVLGDGVVLDPDPDVAVPAHAGTGRDQLADDHVLLQPEQRVGLAADGRLRQHPGG